MKNLAVSQLIDIVPAAEPPRRKRSLRKDTRGLSTVEYVILLALIAIVGIGAWSKFGGTISSKVTEADGALGAVPATAPATTP